MAWPWVLPSERGSEPAVLLKFIICKEGKEDDEEDELTEEEEEEKPETTTEYTKR